MTITIEPPQIEQYAKEKISKAMRAYLERSRAHDDFMKIKNLEYQIGKRHLANMMGEDPENFTQDDIDVKHLHFQFRILFIIILIKQYIINF